MKNKFRAWAEKTTNNKWNYAYDKTEAIRKEFIRVNDEDAFDRYEWMEKFQKEWDELNPGKNEITKKREMITDIKVNESVQRPYGYEVIEVMQYTNLTDKNGTEIAIGDIIQDIYKCLPPCVVEYGDGMIVAGGGWLNAWRASLCEVIGNVYEHPHLLAGNNTDHDPR